MEEIQKKSALLEYIKVIVVTLVVTTIVLYFIQISRVHGASMEPTYQDGNIVIVDKVFYRMGTPEHDDVVVVDTHKTREQFYIKRVIGVPGDHLEIKDGKLYRNSEEVIEDYILEPMEYPDMSVDIPEGKLFVMGDNRNNSSDSREFGYFDIDDDLVGRVFITLF